MAYIKPSAVVYQELANAGGAAASSPDLPACIIGPLNNVLNINVSDSASLANTLAATIDNWTDLAGPELILPFNSTSVYPGQKVDTSSIHGYMINSEVLSYKFSIDLDNDLGSVDTSLLTIDSSTVFGIAGANPTLLLPDSTGQHIAPGDVVVVEHTGGEVDTSFVTAVEKDAVNVGDYAVRLADPLTVATGSSTVSVYRSYDNFNITDLLNTVNANVNGSVNLPVTSIPFALQPDYIFRAASESIGGDSMSIHLGYTASRQDTTSTILTISDVDDLEGKLGEATPENPLALGVSIALANSGGAPIYAIAVESDDTDGHSAALDLAEGQLIYSLVPLTQDDAIITQYKAHVNAMSLPNAGKWRVVLANTAIQEEKYIGQGMPGNEYTSATIVSNGSGGFNLQYSDGTFVADGVTSGDIINVSTATPTSAVGEYTVNKVVNNQMLELVGASEAATGVTVYVSRDQTRLEQAQTIADQSTTWTDKRVTHLQPDQIVRTIDKIPTVLPGYYLACGFAGQCAGFPAQTGFTNVAIAGVEDLVHSNFYFTDKQLNLMAGAGTTVYVQASQGTTPYCRHALTTDTSVLEYREILKVKNLDYLSYYFKSKLDPFIGTWNITDETIQTVRQTIVSSAEALLTRKLPKVGPPLVGYNIDSIKQSETSADSIEIIMSVATVDPNNYTNLHLVI